MPEDDVRNEIRKSNFDKIQKSAEEVFSSPPKLGQAVSREVQLEGETQGCELRYYHDQLGASILRLNDLNGSPMATRSLLVGESRGDDGEQIMRITTDITTEAQHQGKGLGTALMFQTEGMANAVLKKLGVAPGTRVLIIEPDRAKGKAGLDRDGWTSAVFQKMGYENNPDIVGDLARRYSETVSDDEINSGKVWVKDFVFVG